MIQICLVSTLYNYDPWSGAPWRKVLRSPPPPSHWFFSFYRAITMAGAKEWMEVQKQDERTICQAGFEDNDWLASDADFHTMEFNHLLSRLYIRIMPRLYGSEARLYDMLKKNIWKYHQFFHLLKKDELYEILKKGIRVQKYKMTESQHRRIHQKYSRTKSCFFKRIANRRTQIFLLKELRVQSWSLGSSTI